MIMNVIYGHCHCGHCFRFSLTTYKELCSLASDLNQPDLIYKFMHLANHNAIWDSKKVEFSCVQCKCIAQACVSIVLMYSIGMCTVLINA